MKNIILISAVFYLLIISSNSLYSIPDRNPCLNDYHSAFNQIYNIQHKDWNNGWGYNPDSVMIDTCKNSETYSKVFAFQNAYLNYKNFNPFFISNFDRNKRYSIQDIDSLKYPVIYNQFNDFKKEFGNFFFNIIENTYQIGTYRFNQFLELRFTFENYVQTDLVIDKFKSFENIYNSGFDININIPYQLDVEPLTIDEYVIFSNTNIRTIMDLNVLMIYDHLGRLVFYNLDNSQSFDMQNFESGFYFVVIALNGEKYTKKIFLVK